MNTFYQLYSLFIMNTYFRVLFPHGSYEINEDTGEQLVPMVDMGKIKIKKKNVKPSYGLWASVAGRKMPTLYFQNKDAGRVKNFEEFRETTLRAGRQPELIAFVPLTQKEWEEN